MTDYAVFDLGDWRLQHGATLPGAKLAYKTFGQLNAAKDNAIVYPTWFSGQHPDNEWLIGTDKTLNPDHYFIIIPNMLGNGLSSSPSNTPEPYNAARFPRVTIYDNVRAQHALLTQALGIDHIRLVTGWSMGELQTYHWGALYPDMMDLLAPFCGTAKCSRHNYVLLEGLKAALTTDAAFADGWYTQPPTRGLRAMARVYAGWGFSQAFYRQQLDIEALGFGSLEDFLVGFWESFCLPKDANDLLAMIWTWQYGDISDNDLYHGDFERALAAIKAKATVMPCRTDLYFRPEDNDYEVRHMPNAELVPIESVWGHFAGGPNLNPADADFIDTQLKQLLAG